MTQLFVTRAELIPEGETTEDHRKWQQEEADIIERDKSNTDRRTGGLFRGCFGAHRLHSGPIIDDADGVTRCPVCAWEIEDGVCQRCSVAFGSDGEVYSVEDFSDSEVLSFDSDSESVSSSANTAWHAERRAALDADHGDDGDISLDGNGHSVHTSDDMTDGEFAFGRAAAQGLLGRPIRRPSRSNAPADRRRNYARSMLSDVAMTHTDSAAEESDSEDGPESLDGFVVNDEDQDQEPPSSHTFFEGPHEDPRHGAWEYGDVDTERYTTVELRDDDSDEGGAISNGRRRRRVRSSSSISENNTESHGGAGLRDDSPDSDEEQDISRVVLEEGWSPLHQNAARVSTDVESRKSYGGRSPAYPVDLCSDSDSSAPPQRRRRRRKQLSELPYGNDSDHDDNADQFPRRRHQSSSGTITVGRQSLAPESTSSSPPQSSRRARQTQAPILITSSPARPQAVGSGGEFQHTSGRRAHSQSHDIPVQPNQSRYLSAAGYGEDPRLFSEALVRALGRSTRRSGTPEVPRRRPSPRIHSPPQEPLRAMRSAAVRPRARQRSETLSDRAGPSRRHPENTGTDYQSERRRYKERRRQQRDRANSSSNQGNSSSWEDPEEAPRPPVRRGGRLARSIIEEEQEDLSESTNCPSDRGAPWMVSGHYSDDY